MIAIDTNLLVYAHRADVPEHRAAQRALQRAGHDPGGWGIALPCFAEFWAIVSHPVHPGGPSSASEVRRFLESLTAAGAEVWLPGEGFWQRFLQLAGDRAIHGQRVFDLQIALIAFENGASEIWTHDRNFATSPGLRVHDPL